MRVVWQCERDEFCRRVLARHWPGVPCHPDVRALVADTDPAGCGGLSQRDGAAVHGREVREGRHADGCADPERGHAAADEGADAGLERPVPVPVPYVDVLCGGFPCQDISVAGRGEGIDGERSGLWAEYARLIRDLRPRYVIVENVAALLARGMERVLGDLAACGYDAEWDCIPASAVGAPHRRDRVWLVAYAQRGGRTGRPHLVGRDDPAGHPSIRGEGPGDAAGGHSPTGVGVVADANGSPGSAAGSAGEAVSRPGTLERSGRRGGGSGDCWAVEPDVGRVAHGIPARVERLRALGNALVPQIAEWLGRRILEAEGLT
jgi:DNA (cytosine-5)-methyltransferase 1